MSLKVGIVGLPNVGKSTLFNALTAQSAKAQNVPFTTIEPNMGVVPVPDERLRVLAKVAQSAKVVPTTVEFVDIAGLVKNAHKGEGLGNQFLANIREMDAIVHVVRFFEDDDIIHVDNQIDPKRDIETVNTELVLADLATVEKVTTNLEKKTRGGSKEARELLATLTGLAEHLGRGLPAREFTFPTTISYQERIPALLTGKPVLYVANVGEEQEGVSLLQVSSYFTKGEAYITLPVKIERELMELPDKERRVFLREYGLEQTGLDELIQACYKLLGLITFFTAGPIETRAWTVKQGSQAPQAACQVHSDMERGFIRAETVSYEDLAQTGSYLNARARGKVRDEGKEYLVRDGDVMLFKFSV